MAEVFEKNLNIKRDFDSELLAHIKDEKESITDLETTPTIEEIQRAMGRTSTDKVAGENDNPAEFYLALASREEGRRRWSRQREARERSAPRGSSGETRLPSFSCFARRCATTLEKTSRNRTGCTLYLPAV